MAEEEATARFFAYMNLFIFAMLTLVLADNFLLMFVGWEGVGLASYLLIGFWYQRNSAADAAKKAFIVNRIGDLGFLLAIFLSSPTSAPSASHEVFGQIRAHPAWHGRQSSPPSRSSSSSAPPASPPKFPSTSGSPTPWKAPRRSPPSSTPPPWSPPAST